MLSNLIPDTIAKGLNPFRVVRNNEVALKTATDIQRAPLGTVALVKSSSVPELGAHFIVVVGPVVQKPHGMRPKTLTIPADKGNEMVVEAMGHNRPLTVLMLEGKAKEEFMNYYSLEVVKNGVAFKTMDDE